ncbi:MAG: hypothetical protein IJS54_00520 [Desulfovibrio sp.]|nr:hypothetical protein [Desulfovibrio sp.]
MRTLREAGLQKDAEEANKERPTFSEEEKFDIVVASATLNETELEEFARSKGVSVEEIMVWRTICALTNDGYAKETKRMEREVKERDKKIRALESAIRKKDKLIAELTAEIILRKKSRGDLGTSEERMSKENDTLVATECLRLAAVERTSALFLQNFQKKKKPLTCNCFNP